MSVNAAATSASDTPTAGAFLVVPLHKELKRGTLRGILKDANLSVDELRDNL